MDMSEIFETKRVLDELNRISANTSNPEKAKQLIRSKLRESKKKHMEDEQWI